MKTFLITAFLCICTLSLWGQKAGKHPIDVRLEKCMAEPDSETTLGMKDCYAEAAGEWDKELNRYYKLLLRKLSKDEGRKLQAAQRLWLKYRDSETDFYNTVCDNEDGTMWGIYAIERRMDIVRTRALELKKYYDSHIGNYR